MRFSLPYNLAHHINKHHSTANNSLFCKMTNEEALKKHELRHKCIALLLVYYSILLL